MSTSRACVFINSSNPSKPSQLINSQTPLIRPPFPPAINPHDLIISSSSSTESPANHKKIRSRAPNAFIIYRKIFIETARSQGYYLPMTVISSMASQSWEQESDIVKSEYRRLAREAFNIHSEMLPKTFSPRRRRREKWNIISFDSNTSHGHNGSYSRHCSHVNSLKEDNLPGFFSWNNCYDPTLKLPPILSSNRKIHESLPKITVPPMKPRISSKIQLLLNDD